MNPFITVLTPAYNRNYKIGNLYDSLKKQDNKNFIWLIIDDGSTDETEKTVYGWIREGNIEIKYIKKSNGGKHTALNRGIGEVSTPLVIIVDSDDYLSNNAISIIKKYYEKYNCNMSREKLCGYSFLRAFSDGKINSGKFSENEIIDSYREQRINRNDIGDKAEVYYTEVIKKYSFPEFENEKFLPEDAVWLKMSGPYNMVHINEIIYFCDYLVDGLTRTGRYMKVYSPYGMMYRSSVFLNDKEVKMQVQIKMLLLYTIYEFFAFERDKENNISKYEVDKKRTMCPVKRGIGYHLMQLFGYIVFCFWNMQYTKR